MSRCRDMAILVYCNLTTFTIVLFANMHKLAFSFCCNIRYLAASDY